MDVSATGQYEPSVSVQFLPRCPKCGDRHPLAYRPPRRADICPGCGAASAEAGETFSADAVITGQTISVMVARLCFRLGAWLRRLANRLESK